MERHRHSDSRELIPGATRVPLRRVEVTASSAVVSARHERPRPKQGYSDAADRRLPALSRVVVCGSVWISSKKASSLS